MVFKKVNECHYKSGKTFSSITKELVSIISPLYGGTFIDCTFGAGGYSKKILENKLII